MCEWLVTIFQRPKKVRPPTTSNYSIGHVFFSWQFYMIRGIPLTTLFSRFAGCRELLGLQTHRLQFHSPPHSKWWLVIVAGDHVVPHMYGELGLGQSRLVREISWQWRILCLIPSTDILIECSRILEHCWIWRTIRTRCSRSWCMWLATEVTWLRWTVG